MNQVYLSGVIANQPMTSQREGAAARLSLKLCVAHKTAAGEIRREYYDVNAWNHAALWAAAHLRKGQFIALKGYLTQRYWINDGKPSIAVDIAATEFMPRQQGMAKSSTAVKPSA